MLGFPQLTFGPKRKRSGVKNLDDFYDLTVVHLGQVSVVDGGLRPWSGFRIGFESVVLAKVRNPDRLDLDRPFNLAGGILVERGGLCREPINALQHFIDRQVAATPWVEK